MKKRPFFRKGDMKYLANSLICLVLLVTFTFVSCNANFVPSFKASISDSQMRRSVSRVIDAQLETVKDYLDEDLRQSLDGTSSRSGGKLTGEDIVDLTLTEGGRDYLDFTYAVDYSQTTGDVNAVMDTAKSLLSEKEYNDLCKRAQDIERSITEEAGRYSRGVPSSQQAAFYKDLKLLVTRAVVLLAAGVVYAVMPKTVFWGKVTAACAISVGAGLVAISLMSLYEYFKFGTGEGVNFETWFKELLEIPKADFALTASVTAIGEAMGAGPVVTGIIICVFGLYNVVDMARTMLKTYNIDA